MTISSAKFILFFEKVWLFQIKAVPLRHETPPSLFTMLKSAGRFFIMEYTKHPITLADFSIDKNSINVLLTINYTNIIRRTVSDQREEMVGYADMNVQSSNIKIQSVG